MLKVEFNPEKPYCLHVDINSCFASIEQQANPFLRGKPVAVAAYTTPRGCILAASIEAKKLGVKTGMMIFEGRKLCPNLAVLPPDPDKYRNVHLKLRKLISEYTNDFSPKSIDEFALNLKGYPALKKRTCLEVAKEIKLRIKKEIGDWLTVSIGIAPNRYLAKIAAGLHKPDGLDEINKDNFKEVYSNLKLTDLTGIKERNAARLNSMEIYSVLDFYKAPIWRLKAAFHSISGLYWHMRLSGYEVDDFVSKRSSFGNSVALGANLFKVEELSPILARLTEKMSGRLRASGYKAGGIHLALFYKNGTWWHKGVKLSESYFDARDFYRAAFRLLLNAKPQSPVLNVSVSCFNLEKFDNLQLNFFDDAGKRKNLVESEDLINKRWGDFTVGSAKSFAGARIVLDRIAFGGVKELTDLPLDS